MSAWREVQILNWCKPMQEWSPRSLSSENPYMCFKLAASSCNLKIASNFVPSFFLMDAPDLILSSPFYPVPSNSSICFRSKELDGFASLCSDRNWVFVAGLEKAAAFGRSDAISSKTKMGLDSNWVLLPCRPIAYKSKAGSKRCQKLHYLPYSGSLWDW